MVRQLVRLFAVAATLSVTLAGPVLGNSAWAGEERPGLENLGLLPNTGDATYSYVAATDPRTRSMYYLHISPDTAQWYLARYRPTGGVPKLAYDAPIPRDALPSGWVPPPRKVAYESRRNRLLIAVADPSSLSTIVVFDLSSRTLVAVWKLTDPARFPSFSAEGITYSAEDDRIYLVGETVASWHAENNDGVRPQVVTTIIAINAQTGERIWAVPLLNCQQPLNTVNVGALIARSVRAGGIFVPCAQSLTDPRSSGISKLILGPDGGRADQQAAIRFASEFFPISGRYQRENISGVLGEAVFDPGSDRIFVQSLSVGTPGTWVFDAFSSAWAGFVYAPDFNMDILEVNAATGHFYVTGTAGPLIATDGRGTPLPQGDLYPIGAMRLAADTGGRLLYAQVNIPNKGVRWAVFRDDSPDEPPYAPTDFDRLTTDTPETADTNMSFAGGITGYGSRLSWVGGGGGTSRSTPLVTVRPETLGAPSQFGGFGVQDAGVGPADRSLLLARVADLDVRDSGSSASAQAVASDSNSQDEWNTRPETVASACDKTTTRLGRSDAPCQPDPSPSPGAMPSTPDGALTAASGQLPSWPWDPTTCLDSGSEDGMAPAPAENLGGKAAVTCSASDNEATAWSKYGPFEVSVAPGISSGPASTNFTIDVGSSYFLGETRRDAKLGTVTYAFARATGVKLATPTATVTIGEVTEEVTATAHGRPGMNHYDVTRRLSGIAIDRNGGRQAVEPCSDRMRDGTANMPSACSNTLEQIDRVVGEFGRVEMPLGDYRASPRGAFAGYQKTQAQFYNDLTAMDDDTKAAPALQIVAFADADKKNRIRLQLAAIEATAVYEVSPPVDYGSGGSGGTYGPTSELPSNPESAVTIPTEPIASMPSRLFPRSLGEAAQGITAFLLRSPGQAFEFCLILLLLMGSLAGLAKRRHARNLITEEDSL